MTKARILLLTLLVGLWPAQAHAARGFWAWLEELSGPGPFHGRPIVAFTVACVTYITPSKWCPSDFERTRPTVVSEWARSTQTEGRGSATSLRRTRTTWGKSGSSRSQQA